MKDTAWMQQQRDDLAGGVKQLLEQRRQIEDRICFNQGAIKLIEQWLKDETDPPASDALTVDQLQSMIEKGA